jgi:hypothetical protein
MAPPSLHRAPSGRFPCFISTMERSDSLPPLSSGFVAFALRYRLSTRLFAPFPGGMLPGEGIRKRLPALPLRIPFSGGDRASQVPGGPQCLHALLFDPGGTLPLLLYHARMLPSAGNTTSASATILSRLNHTAYRPPVYASQPGLPQNHATLGSGCQHALPGRIDCLPGPTKEFLLPTGGFPSFQALPGARYPNKPLAQAPYRNLLYSAYERRLFRRRNR